MAYEDLFEPIEVIVYFRKGRIIPLKFLWNDRPYVVKRVNARWKENLGAKEHIHFSVQSDGPDCFDLLFDTADYTWQLARVYLEG